MLPSAGGPAARRPQRSAANPQTAVAGVDRRDRETDARTFDRYVDPAARIHSAVN